MRLRTSASFIEPCLHSPADELPSDSNWSHEIKHNGFCPSSEYLGQDWHLAGSGRGHDNELRTHRSLGQDAPIPRATQHVGRVTSGLVLGGLHHVESNSRYRQDEMVDVNTRTFRGNMMS